MKTFIRDAALTAGFDACGIARAEALTADAELLKQWINEGKHGDMQFFERNFEKRTDPRELVPGCKSVVVLLHNYFPERVQPEGIPKIAKYAYSAIDYHTVIKEKLGKLETLLKAEFGDDCVNNDYQHSFVDSAPVLEKRWAEKAGLGWLGRHSQLIHPKFGSSVFIAVLMLNREIEEYDLPHPFRCGTCSKCIDACPTGALVAGETMDARKCISYINLESKSDIPEELKNKLSGYITGCDICNNACPWNKRFAHPHTHPELKPTEAIFNLTHADWQAMTNERFNQIFSKSAVKRAGLQRIQRITNCN